MQQMAASEWANFIPYQSSDAGVKYSHRKRIYKRRTGIVTQVTPPDEHGYVNLGLDTFYTESVMDQSEWVIAEVNPNMPRTYGQTNFHVSRFTAFVENPNPIIAVPTPPATDLEVKMAENVVALLKDRDCIQVGIGAVPAMISKLLENSGLKDLGIHTEMMPAGTHKLVEKGVVTCKYKKVNPGKIVLAFTLGDKELYDWIANNPMCEFRPTSYANYIPVIAQEDNIVAINGSIEVDLTGQVVSESVGNIIRSGTGGQLDFVIGAFWSKGGRAINLVPATTMNDTVSRIVPYIAQGARVTVPRHYTGYVVTEYGAADLYGRSEPERAVELIKIAHPKFREELEKAGRERGLIKKKIF
jgi:4-hydroxybutyrate CoA-transferase